MDTKDLDIILYPSQFSHKSEPILAEKPEKRQTFDDLEAYFTKILEYFPIEKEIKVNEAKDAFSKLTNQVRQLQGKSIKNTDELEKANSIASNLFRNCREIINVIPLAIGNDKVEPSTPKKRGSFMNSAFKLNKNDPRISEGLKHIDLNCEGLQKLGEKIGTSLNLETEIDELLQLINKVKDLMKVSNTDALSDAEITSELFNLQQTLSETENNISAEQAKFEENQKNKARLEGNIFIGTKRLESTNIAINEIKEQIGKLKKEMVAIKACKGKINENFERTKEAVILKGDEKLKGELQQKALLNAKVNEEQQKVMADLKQMITIREKKVNYIIIIDRSGSMYNQIAQVNAAAQNFLAELKKTNNNNFFFSVVYFESSSTIMADTVTLSSTSNFDQYLNLSAAGGTSYCQGLSNV